MSICVANFAASGEEVATVKGDRVNVRGQAKLNSEVVTQLKRGEAVTVLEEIEVKKPKKGDPPKWAKILLPANTPVWVYAPYIELTNKTVNIRRLNVRAGPGENYSILGRLDRGTPVKEIRVVENWMEIEAPATACAFVAADLLEDYPDGVWFVELAPLSDPDLVPQAVADVWDLKEEPGRVALAWVLQQPGVTSPIIGPRTLEQLDGALKTLELQLPADTLKRLDQIFPGPGGPAPEAFAW